MEQKKDLVNHPAHYTYGKYEHEQVVRDWELGYHLGNATKYIMRSPHKGTELLDLEKARWYLNQAIKESDCAFVKFWKGDKERSKFSVRDVADDWIKNDSNLHMVMVSIGTAAILADGRFPDDAMENLKAALGVLDIKIRNAKAEQLSQSSMLDSEKNDSPPHAFQRSTKPGYFCTLCGLEENNIIHK